MYSRLVRMRMRMRVCVCDSHIKESLYEEDRRKVHKD